MPNDQHPPQLYSLCCFAPGQVVPEVELIDADTDDEAVILASRRKFAMRRELWERHRLVAHIPASH